MALLKKSRTTPCGFFLFILKGKEVSFLALTNE